MSRVISVAHRGASGRGHCPENTLSAFRRAIELGVDCVECDVHCTKDGHVVVIHDATLNRTTDKKGNVEEMTLDMVKEADAGAWFAPQFAGERVPTLREVLELTKGKVVTLVEVKPNDITDKVVREIEREEAVNEVILQSFHPEVVRTAQDLNPKIPRALLVSGRIPIIRLSGVLELIHNAVEAGASMLNLPSRIITPTLIKESHKRGLSVWAWTVDDEEEMKELITMGVDGITSNHPEKLLSVIQQA